MLRHRRHRRRSRRCCRLNDQRSNGMYATHSLTHHQRHRHRRSLCVWSTSSRSMSSMMLQRDDCRRRRGCSTTRRAAPAAPIWTTEFRSAKHIVEQKIWTENLSFGKIEAYRASRGSEQNLTSIAHAFAPEQQLLQLGPRQQTARSSTERFSIRVLKLID